MNKGNIAASIRQKLLNQARIQKRPFQELLQFYAMERFLYRLGQSEYSDRFILKGALMLRLWHAPQSRPTRDIDLLGYTDNNPQAIAEQIQEILATEAPIDGLQFEASQLDIQTIKEDADYQGVRVRFPGQLSGAQFVMQLDIGFGDALVPGASRAEFPTLLGLPAPRILCYSRESAIAEKFEAMVTLGDLNSRMKDFYDIWLLARQFDFDSELLGEAIHQTFRKRSTELPDTLPFSPEFIVLKQTQWRAFLRRLGDETVPENLSEICDVLQVFLPQFLNHAEIVQNQVWKAPGPWRHQ